MKTTRRRRAPSSADNNEASDLIMECASCGIAEVDDIKLKERDDCDLVRYCCDEYQKNHQPEHDEESKIKMRERAAELRDELLFKQPASCAILGIARFAVYLCRLT